MRVHFTSERAKLFFTVIKTFLALFKTSQIFSTVLFYFTIYKVSTVSKIRKVFSRAKKVLKTLKIKFEDLLTMMICMVNSTPNPTARMVITAGTAERVTPRNSITP